MIIEVLDKHYGGLTTLKKLVNWYVIHDGKANTDKIMVRFKKEGNDMKLIKNGVMLRIIEEGEIAYIPIMQLFDNYSDEEAEIIGKFKLIRRG